MKVRVQVASPETRLWQFSPVAATAQSVSAVRRNPGSRSAMDMVAGPDDRVVGGRLQDAVAPAGFVAGGDVDRRAVPGGLPADAASRASIIGSMKIGSSAISSRKSRTLNRASGLAQPRRLAGPSALVIEPLVAHRDTAVKARKIRSGSGNFSRSGGM